jgi:hypothetical protein
MVLPARVNKPDTAFSARTASPRHPGKLQPADELRSTFVAPPEQGRPVALGGVAHELVLIDQSAPSTPMERHPPTNSPMPGPA